MSQVSDVFLDQATREQIQEFTLENCPEPLGWEIRQAFMEMENGVEEVVVGREEAGRLQLAILYDCDRPGYWGLVRNLRDYAGYFSRQMGWSIILTKSPEVRN